MTRDGINHVARVAPGDGGCWGHSREKSQHVEGSQFRGMRRQPRWINSGQIAPDCIVKGAARAPAKGVEDRAVDLSRTKACDQGIEAVRGSICNLSLVVGGEMAKRGAWFNRVRVSSGGKSEREAQLLKICLVGQREILIEPFWARASPLPRPNTSGHQQARCVR